MVANTVEKRSDMINNAAIMIPSAICIPLPPLVLRLAITTPIIVNNNTAAGVALRRYRSTFNVFKPSVPLSSSFSINRPVQEW